MNDSITTFFRCGLRGFHVDQDIWKPAIGETLHFIQVRNNNHNRYVNQSISTPRPYVTDPFRSLTSLHY